MVVIKWYGIGLDGDEKGGNKSSLKAWRIYLVGF